MVTSLVIAIPISNRKDESSSLVAVCRNVCKKRRRVLMPIQTPADLESVRDLSKFNDILFVTAALLRIGPYNEKFVPGPFGAPDSMLSGSVQHYLAGAFQRQLPLGSSLPEWEENCISLQSGDVSAYYCGTQLKLYNGNRVSCACKLEGRALFVDV